ncbi:MAG: S8/S53 family peptidase [Chloroflexota bacterium]
MDAPDQMTTSAIAGHQANIFVIHNNGSTPPSDDLKKLQGLLTSNNLSLRDIDLLALERGDQIGVTFAPAAYDGEASSVTILATKDVPEIDPNPVAMLEDEAKLFASVRQINGEPDPNPDKKPIPRRTESTQFIASPNWQMGSTMYISPGGGGGPGKHRYKADVQPNSPKFNWNVSSVITDREKPQQQLGGAKTIASKPLMREVNVFILDTLPPKETVKCWLERTDGHRLTEVLKVAKLYYAHEKNIEILPAVQRPGHPEDLFSRMTPFAKDVPGSDWALNLPEDENISDHGIFIAGIIHSMVPSATLHIIQVLNDGGAGTMLSLAQGLQVMGQIMKADPTTPAVVNLSVAFCNPQQIFINAIDKGFEGQIKLWADFLGILLSDDELNLLTTVFPDSDQPYETDQTDLMKQMEAKNTLKTVVTKKADALFEQTVQPLELIYQLAKGVATPNTVFVAAAGNDGGKLPRYPASSPIVFGVGAVGKKAWNTKLPELKPTSYSNNPPDAQPLEGSWAFGGDYKDDGSDKEDGGILSVSTITSTGYAWWAGTSFATAAMSGTVARYIRSANPLPADAKTSVDFLHNNAKHGRVHDRNGNDRGPLVDTRQP